MERTTRRDVCEKCHGRGEFARCANDGNGNGNGNGHEDVLWDTCVECRGEGMVETGRKRIPIIGLVGYAGAGKDLVGALLRMMEYRRVAFGDALKAEVAEFMSVGNVTLAPSELDSDLQYMLNARQLNAGDVYRKPTSEVMRRILQQWGTEYRRKQYAGYWVKLANDRVKKLGGLSVVVTDVRFQNEVDWVHSLGGKVWKVERPGAEGEEMRHSSEAADELMGVDATIANTGTVYQLAEKVEEALK